jgi:geranylgeranyl pyrophosphate synthase
MKNKQDSAILHLLKPIHPDLKIVNERLFFESQSVEEPIRSMLIHSFKGGKRLRPAIIILLGKMFSADIEPFYTLSTAVEMIHTASLIHDDILDGDLKRRSKETLHIKWPLDASILLGDYLFASSVNLLTELKNQVILDIFTETLRKICACEIREIFRKDLADKKEYFNIIQGKTASLLSSIAEMAGILSQVSTEQRNFLRKFGNEFGISYQIIDDILDFPHDINNVNHASIFSLPIYSYIEETGDKKSINSLMTGNLTPEKIYSIYKAIQNSGALEFSFKEALTHTDNCRKYLKKFPENAYREILFCLIDWVIARARDVHVINSSS